MERLRVRAHSNSHGVRLALAFGLSANLILPSAFAAEFSAEPAVAPQRPPLDAMGTGPAPVSSDSSAALDSAAVSNSVSQTADEVNQTATNSTVPLNTNPVAEATPVTDAQSTSAIPAIGDNSSGADDSSSAAAQDGQTVSAEPGALTPQLDTSTPELAPQLEPQLSVTPPSTPDPPIADSGTTPNSSVEQSSSTPALTVGFEPQERKYVLQPPAPEAFQYQSPLLRNAMPANNATSVETSPTATPAIGSRAPKKSLFGWTKKFRRDSNILDATVVTDAPAFAPVLQQGRYAPPMELVSTPLNGSAQQDGFFGAQQPQYAPPKKNFFSGVLSLIGDLGRTIGTVGLTSGLMAAQLASDGNGLSNGVGIFGGIGKSGTQSGGSTAISGLASGIVGGAPTSPASPIVGAFGHHLFGGGAHHLTGGGKHNISGFHNIGGGGKHNIGGGLHNIGGGGKHNLGGGLHNIGGAGKHLVGGGAHAVGGGLHRRR